MPQRPEVEERHLMPRGAGGRTRRIGTRYCTLSLRKIRVSPEKSEEISSGSEGRKGQESPSKEGRGELLAGRPLHTSLLISPDREGGAPLPLLRPSITRDTHTTRQECRRGSSVRSVGPRAEQTSSILQTSLLGAAAGAAGHLERLRGH